MPTPILMPALSPTMEDGKLAKWLVAAGSRIRPGDIIAEIETDKATMEVEAVDEGVVTELLVAAGTEKVKVNTPIAMIDTADAAAVAVPSRPNGGGQTSPRPMPDAPPPVVVPGPSILIERPREIAVDAAAPLDAATITQTMREALRDAMAEEMRRDPDVFLMGEEVAQYQGAYKVSQGLLDEFGPRRVIDTPITEQGFAGVGVGAAFSGLKPIVEFMTWNFGMQAIDQIINSAAKTLYMSGGQMGSPIVFRGPNGATARVGAQHSHDFAALYANIPGLKVVMPYTAADAKGLLKTAVRDNNPVIFLENEILYGRSFDVPELDDFVVPFGKARIARAGKDVTIVSFGIGMSYALTAAEELAKDGIEAEVIDLRTLRPMDTATVLRSVQKTNRCVTVEEGFPQGSVGNYVSAVIMQEAFDWLDAPVINVAGKDVPMPYAANLEKFALVTVPEVIAAVKAVTYR